MAKWIKIGLGALFVLLFALALLITSVDRSPYRTKEFYQVMDDRLDSLENSLAEINSSDTLLIGWSKINITPTKVLPLAGYGARDPKEFDDIRDSIFIRAISFNDGLSKVVIVAADLLIIHPKLTKEVYKLLSPEGWGPEQIFFSTTHSHSSTGGWAPGLVGDLFAGQFDLQEVARLASKVKQAVLTAEKSEASGYFSYNELQVPELVKNRLMGQEGTRDVSFKVMGLISGEKQGYLSVYAAHATTLGRNFRSVSGDYPGVFNHLVENDSTIDFSAFAAGAVGSMGPVTKIYEDEWKESEGLAMKLVEHIELLSLLGPEYGSDMPIHAFKLPLSHRAPYFKITKDLALRPWVFESVFGSFASEIAVFQIGSTLMIGLPCDFSGELALPLYELARANGLHLVVTSFNGGYMGYVVKDEWYDENKYESRTMSWYGPDTGSYLSEIVSRIIVYASKIEP